MPDSKLVRIRKAKVHLVSVLYSQIGMDFTVHMHGLCHLLYESLVIILVLYCFSLVNLSAWDFGASAYLGTTF